MSKNPMEEMPQAGKSPEKNILNDFKVEEVNISGDEYYSLDRHFILPSGSGEKLFKKSMCPNGLEEYIQKLIKADEKKTADLAKYKIKKEIESLAEAESDKKAKEKEISFRKEMANIFINLPEGGEYGGMERIPFTAKEVGSNHNVVSLVKKQNGKIIFKCSSSGNIFGHSKNGYYSKEEIDATDFLKKELEK